MDITTLGAWGGFLGGIAVVVSLIYLASQIRQNSKLLRASTASATTASSADFSSLIVQDSETIGCIFAGRPSTGVMSVPAAGHFERDDTLDTQTYKALIGTTRRTAMPLMELLDAEHLTVRRGEIRRLRTR